MTAIANLEVVFVHPDQSRTPGRIVVHAPERIDEFESSCAVTLEGLEANSFTLHGADTLQALTLALRFAAKRLSDFEASGGWVADVATEERIPLDAYFGVWNRTTSTHGAPADLQRVRGRGLDFVRRDLEASEWLFGFDGGFVLHVAAPWRFVSDGTILVGFQDRKEPAEAAAELSHRLQDRVIELVEISTSGDLVLGFGVAGTIEIFNSSSADDGWVLKDADGGGVVGEGGGGVAVQEEPPAGGITVGGPPNSLKVSLCVYADDLEPDWVTRQLGTAPTQAHKKGELFGRKQLPRRIGAWISRIEVEAPASAQEALDALLAQLPVDPAVWSELSARHSIVVSFGVFLMDGWNRGFVIAPETVARLATMGVELSFDIYS